MSPAPGLPSTLKDCADVEVVSDWIPFNTSRVIDVKSAFQGNINTYLKQSTLMHTKRVSKTLWAHW